MGKKESGYRSRMNVPFCVADGDEALTDLFLVECWERGIVGLRTVTPFGKGIYLRASLYHGVSYDEVVVLTNFMREFAAKHSAKAVEEERAVVTPMDSPVQQALTGLDLCCAMNNMAFNELSRLSSSPDTVMDRTMTSSPDTVMDRTMTWPKNLKVNEYARIADDMFAPPPVVMAPAPPVLR